jgi:hypothetical protein
MFDTDLLPAIQILVATLRVCFVHGWRGRPAEYLFSVVELVALR